MYEILYCTTNAARYYMYTQGTVLPITTKNRTKKYRNTHVCTCTGMYRQDYDLHRTAVPAGYHCCLKPAVWPRAAAGSLHAASEPLHTSTCRPQTYSKHTSITNTCTCTCQWHMHSSSQPVVDNTSVKAHVHELVRIIHAPLHTTIHVTTTNRAILTM